MACLRTTTVNGHCFTNGNSCQDNVGFGCKSFQNINSGSRYNVAVGYCALAGTASHCKMFTVAVGYKALVTNCTVCNAVAIGSSSFAQSHGVSVGAYANASADGVAIGGGSYSGPSGVAIGRGTIAGNKGVALGSCAQSGSCGVAIGRYAGLGQDCATSIGMNAQGAKCSTVIGFDASTSGSVYGIVIGRGSSTGGFGNVINIGEGYSSGGKDTISWNMTHGGDNIIYRAWDVLSDCRDKTNVRPLEYNMGLPLVRNINPVTFKWDRRDRYVVKCGFEKGVKDGTLREEKLSVGVLAQELKQTMDDLNLDTAVVRYNELHDRYSIMGTQLFASVVKSIQQLNNRLESVKDRIETLEEI
jgi:hypothetical protein